MPNPWLLGLTIVVVVFVSVWLGFELGAARREFDAAVRADIYAELEATAPASCTCYIGHPDDPNADEEACEYCDREFWSNPLYWIGDIDGF